MKRIVSASLFVILLAGAAQAENKVRATLVSSTPSAVPGSTFDVAIPLSIPAGMYISWSTPRVNAAPPSVKWRLSPGISAGTLRFPTPQKIPLSDGKAAIGYDRDIALLTTITINPNYDADGPIDLAADVQWLACSDAVTLEKQTVAATLSIGGVTEQNIPQFAAWRAEQPERVAGNDSRVDIWMGDATGHDVLSIAMPAEFEDATDIELVPPGIDFITFDGPPRLHAIVGGMMVTQSFTVAPGEHPRTHGTALLIYTDGKKRQQTVALDLLFGSSSAGG